MGWEEIINNKKICGNPRGYGNGVPNKEWEKKIAEQLDQQGKSTIYKKYRLKLHFIIDTKNVNYGAYKYGPDLDNLIKAVVDKITSDGKKKDTTLDCIDRDDKIYELIVSKEIATNNESGVTISLWGTDDTVPSPLKMDE